MHCHTACGQWAVELPQCAATLPGGSGQWNSCNALPHCLGAVGGRSPALRRHTALGQWVVQFLQSTATLPTGSGQWSARSHSSGVHGHTGCIVFCALCVLCCNAWCSALQCTVCAVLHYTLCAVPSELATRPLGSGTPLMHCHTTWGQRAVEIVQCTATLHVGSGQPNSCSSVPHCLRAHCLRIVGSGSCNVPPQCLGQWAVGILQCTATLPVDAGQWNSCNSLPQCFRAVGNGSCMYRHTACGQWAVGFLRCTATLPGGISRWNSYNAPPHCLGAVGNKTLAMHCHTACGQWAVEPLQCTAVPSGPCPPAGGTGSPAQVAVGAYGGPVGDGSCQRPGPISWGHGECYPCGGRCLWRACRGRQFPTARAH